MRGSKGTKWDSQNYFFWPERKRFKIYLQKSPILVIWGMGAFSGHIVLKKSNFQPLLMKIFFFKTQETRSRSILDPF